ncbi:MAG: hypothetical protein Q7S22_01475 [Candidatus Micrarchaeota archaeon]|nr:hypothetical protein [Candidatus Micrarchaeota archaeon]
MGDVLIQKMVYNYKFGWNEIIPMLDSKPMLEKEDMMKSFATSIMAEGVTKTEKEEAEVLAESKQSDSGSGSNSSLDSTGDGTTETNYTITYYNPVTHKAEILSGNTTIKTKDYIKKGIEESTASRSTYPIYSLVASPLFMTVIDQDKLEQILNEREYGTPPPFGAAPMIKLKTSNKSEIVAVPDVKQAMVESMKRKVATEQKLDDEIVSLESSIEKLKLGTSSVVAISELGPLTRVRFLTALKKGKIKKENLMILLKQDISFLTSIKKKLTGMGTGGLLELVRSIGELKDKK